jgi:hypothetical protein
MGPEDLIRAVVAWLNELGYQPVKSIYRFDRGILVTPVPKYYTLDIPDRVTAINRENRWVSIFAYNTKLRVGYYTDDPAVDCTYDLHDPESLNDIKEDFHL